MLVGTINFDVVLPLRGVLHLCSVRLFQHLKNVSAKSNSVALKLHSKWNSEPTILRFWEGGLLLDVCLRQVIRKTLVVKGQLVLTAIFSELSFKTDVACCGRTSDNVLKLLDKLSSRDVVFDHAYNNQTLHFRKMKEKPRCSECIWSNRHVCVVNVVVASSCCLFAVGKGGSHSRATWFVRRS